MIEIKEIYESELPNGEIISSDDEEKLLLIPKLLAENLEKVRYFYEQNQKYRFFSSGLAVVKKSGKYGYIDKMGKDIIPCQYDYAGSFLCGLAVVRKNNKYGYIDKTGRNKISYQYDYAENFSHDTALVKDGQKWQYINCKGEVLPLKVNLTEQNRKIDLIYNLTNSLGYPVIYDLMQDKTYQVKSMKIILAIIKENGQSIRLSPSELEKIKNFKNN